MGQRAVERGGEEKGGERIRSRQYKVQCSVGVYSINPASVLQSFLIYSVHFHSLFFSSTVHPGAQTHTHTEAPTVAANWTDSLAIDLLQVSPGSLCTVQLDEAAPARSDLSQALTQWCCALQFFPTRFGRLCTFVFRHFFAFNGQGRFSHGSSDVNTHWEHIAIFQDK